MATGEKDRREREDTKGKGTHVGFAHPRVVGGGGGGGCGRSGRGKEESWEKRKIVQSKNRRGG